MSRGLAAANLTAAQAAFVVPVVFVHFNFDSGDLYLHTDLGDITTTTPAATWTGVGDFGSIDAIEESSDIAAKSLKLSLSGIDSTILNEALNENYWERDCTIYIGFRDTVSGAIVEQPHRIGDYYVSRMQVSPSQIDVTLEDELADWDRTANEFYTDQDQRRRFSGDTFLSYVTQMEDLTLRIGDRNLTVGEIERDFDRIDRGEGEFGYF